MGWKSDAEHGAGEEPNSGRPGCPSSAKGHGDPGPSDAPSQVRDPRLPGFGHGGEWDTCPPSAALAATLDAVSGPGWRCPGAEHDELLGVLRQWQALESWAVAGKLSALRALIREDDQPLPGG